MMNELESALAPYNAEVGYNIEQVIRGLGFEEESHIKDSNMEVFKFKHSTGNKALLIISNHISPVFYESTKNDKRVATVIFGKNLQATEFISLPKKDLGAVEYGIDLNNPTTMEFFTEAKRRYRYVEDPEHLNGPVLPDEVRTLNDNDPISVLTEMKLWASEIRRSLAPKHDLASKTTQK